MCRFGMDLSGIAQWTSETNRKEVILDEIGYGKSSALDLQRWQANRRGAPRILKDIARKGGRQGGWNVCWRDSYLEV